MVITFHKYKLVLTSKSMWIGPGYFTTTIKNQDGIIIGHSVSFPYHHCQQRWSLQWLLYILKKHRVLRNWPVHGYVGTYHVIVHDVFFVC